MLPRAKIIQFFVKFYILSFCHFLRSREFLRRFLNYRLCEYSYDTEQIIGFRMITIKMIVIVFDREYSFFIISCKPGSTFSMGKFT